MLFLCPFQDAYDTHSFMNDEIPVYKNSLNYAFLSDILYIRRQDIGDRRNDFSVSQILTHLDISVERKEIVLKKFFPSDPTYYM